MLSVTTSEVMTPPWDKPLSLDKQTISNKPKPPEEEKQLSRRDLFSFGNFMKSAAELDVKPIEETGEEESENSKPADDSIETPTEEPDTDSSQVEKKGFFKRLISRFRTGSKPDETGQTSIDQGKSASEIIEEELSLPKVEEEPNKTNKQTNRS